MTRSASLPMSTQLLHDDPSIDSLTLAVNYNCNSACRFCFIEPELSQRLSDTPVAFLERVYDENRLRGGLYQRLIFSGAECTLRKDLPDLARVAIERGGFEVVRIQTNARRLRNEALLASLIDAGITEYFVSVHAGNAELDAYLTRDPRSFEEMRGGLAAIRKSGAMLVSNTVITRGSYQHLEETADFLIAEQIPECQFWAFIEFGDIGQGSEHVSYVDSAPYLRRAISKLKAAGRKVVVSWFPECLLGEHDDTLENHRASLLIHDEFSQRAARSSGFSCPKQSSCVRFGKSCQGLHERYMANSQDDPGAYVPYRRARTPG
ncbi:MAG: radical SAM protein [Myxococcales bacterium]|nr:radical SAM protein [Myxococcales bacterium]